MATSGTSAANPPRSAPAQKALSPAPVRTTARTSSESRAVLHRVDQLGQHLAGEHVALLRVVRGSPWRRRRRPRSGPTRGSPSARHDETEAELESGKCYCPLAFEAAQAALRNQRTRRETSGDRDDQRLQRDQARPRGRAQALHLHPGARRPARVDAVVGEEGAVAAPQRVGGHLLADLGDEARRRARLPRPLLPGGVRRPGRRLLLLAGPRRVHELLGLRAAPTWASRSRPTWSSRRSTCSAPRSRSASTSNPA